VLLALLLESIAEQGCSDGLGEERVARQLERSFAGQTHLTEGSGIPACFCLPLRIVLPSE